MKHYLFTVIFVMITMVSINAQILGFYSNETKEVFTELDLTTKKFSDLQTFNWVELGEYTFDPVLNRYFTIASENGSSFYIAIINAQTGAIIDKIPNTVGLKGIQYKGDNKIIGSYWDEDKEVFAELDLTTKKFSTIQTLTSVEWVEAGESTFDPNLNRYFIIASANGSDDYITIIDAQTGAIIDRIFNSVGLKGIQYKGDNKIIGSYWDENKEKEVFAELDLMTKKFSAIQTLIGVEWVEAGESTFDPNLNRYFIIASENGIDDYIIIIDAQTGAIIDKISNSAELKGIQYKHETSAIAPHKDKNLYSINVYPNPAGNLLNIVISENTNELIIISDLFGKIVHSEQVSGKQISIDISNLRASMYMVRIGNKVAKFIKH
ncbi:MAG TPA: T9SS type A sorting domain-containing protein [Bacteroidales bacterium]|nr:T9SS type A sorting domain-containing protein [Bacteroidales bacterium]